MYLLITTNIYEIVCAFIFCLRICFSKECLFVSLRFFGFGEKGEDVFYPRVLLHPILSSPPVLLNGATLDVVTFG